MIASLHGTVESLGSGWAIINVNGIGLQVYLPTSTLSTLGTIGKEVYLNTHLVMREDSITLYGFASSEEMGLFQTLMSVSGIGPKLALATLSALSVEQASLAIATGNVDLLRMVPGIGKKTAERLILELKDKVGAGLIATSATQLVQGNTDVLAALTSLGYSISEASRAVATLPPEETLSLEEKVKLALQHFATK